VLVVWLAAREVRSVTAVLVVLLRAALARRGIRLPQAEAPRRGRPKKKENE